MPYPKQNPMWHLDMALWPYLNMEQVPGFIFMKKDSQSPKHGWECVFSMLALLLCLRKQSKGFFALKSRMVGRLWYCHEVDEVLHIKEISQWSNMDPVHIGQRCPKLKQEEVIISGIKNRGFWKVFTRICRLFRTGAWDAGYNQFFEEREFYFSYHCFKKLWSLFLLFFPYHSV